MPEPPAAFIIVDYQNDFLPGGALGVPEGDKIRQAIVSEAEMSDIELIVLTRDWHPPDHVSFSGDPTFEDMSWPTHCVAGKYGAQIEPMLWGEITRLGKPIAIVDKGVEKIVEAYSGFDGRITETYGMNRDYIGKTLEFVLSDLGFTQVFVAGLALEYCVRSTAIDAIRRGYHAKIYLDETRGLTQPGAIRTALYLQREGVRIV